MTPFDTTNLTSNIIADRALCVEWAHATGLLSALAAANPLVRINQMTARQYLDRAIGYLVQDGVSLRDLWGLEDLVTPDAFTKIIRSALAQSRTEAQCMAIVLVTTAREWIGVDPDHHQELAAQLPPTAYSRRFTTPHSRSGQVYPRRSKQNRALKTSA